MANIIGLSLLSIVMFIVIISILLVHDNIKILQLNKNLSGILQEIFIVFIFILTFLIGFCLSEVFSELIDLVTINVESQI